MLFNLSYSRWCAYFEHHSGAFKIHHLPGGLKLAPQLQPPPQACQVAPCQVPIISQIAQEVLQPEQAMLDPPKLPIFGKATTPGSIGGGGLKVEERFLVGVLPVTAFPLQRICSSVIFHPGSLTLVEMFFCKGSMGGKERIQNTRLSH